MKAEFIATTTTGEIDGLFRQSMEAPVVLFNFDPYCPISLRAYDEVSKLARPVAIVDVARHTDVTAYISAQTGVRHESPQLLILYQGAAVWSASHFRITQELVERVLAQSGAPGAPPAAG